MSDNELAAKMAVLVAVVIGIIALGYVIVFAIAPIFVLASIIDFGFRQKYNQKLDALRGSNELNEGPNIHSFDARLHEGRVIIGWLTDLPGDAHLDIYRVTGTGGGSIDEIAARGTCVHSTARDFTENLDEAFQDDILPGEVVFYVLVVSGLQIKKEPLPYSFLSFARDVQFITRKTRVRVRGDAVRVEAPIDEPIALPDERGEAERLADEVLAQFQTRKKFDADLDAAIARIKDSHDLTEDEKAEAIELMETRAASI